jgi:hypothetical protein
MHVPIIAVLVRFILDLLPFLCVHPNIAEHQEPDKIMRDKMM